MLTIQAQSNIPTDFGVFTVYAFSEHENDWNPHLVLVSENSDFTKAMNVRFHSECITGEIFHSKKCECGQQLNAAMKYMAENGGMIVYLRQEGRNIGIINKLKAYALQEKGFDTVEANLMLGLPADGRNFNIAVEILKILNVKEINLLTNNPDKLKSLENSGIHLKSRIPLEIESNEVNQSYLVKKKDYFGHLLQKV
ncbi:GTP cyclohydrolase II [Elizabethkingia meningoseptica]|uniref:GTP cyclohydrolase-2 n=1 Tax=Elizabethkingia meningoseptica TaxID=238 RepID=A0A1T3IJP2_ELIME|nr:MULTISPECIES: GTP cyclohydrolase II [Elizabethkingia]MCT3914450.1 GTP cyclohydrolase II [Elizabethkingia anophelis]AQX12707.1 GTP cyclohydrolase II [Elizabethkingia meningoseptica]MBG0514219.1 GTP cyclohydrolase II [Elizabethkingia meningoseptica]MCT3947655.1 GTP cyclohydrolase II [Elizabethkingia anophelis]MDE5433136.1 GTP cyclohydrolase II [Elizabethkingia meningoseptica]